MATHSSVLAWRILETGEPGGLPSMGSHRVGHDWSDSAAAAAAIWYTKCTYNVYNIVYPAYTISPVYITFWFHSSPVSNIIKSMLQMRNWRLRGLKSLPKDTQPGQAGWSPSLSPSLGWGQLYFLDHLGQIPQPFWISYMRDGAHATMHVRSWGLMEKQGLLGEVRQRGIRQSLVSQKERWSWSQETCFSLISWVAHFPMGIRRGWTDRSWTWFIGSLPAQRPAKSVVLQGWRESGWRLRGVANSREGPQDADNGMKHGWVSPWLLSWGQRPLLGICWWTDRLDGYIQRSAYPGITGITRMPF